MEYFYNFFSAFAVQQKFTIMHFDFEASCSQYYISILRSVKFWSALDWQAVPFVELKCEMFSADSFNDQLFEVQIFKVKNLFVSTTIDWSDNGTNYSCTPTEMQMHQDENNKMSSLIVFAKNEDVKNGKIHGNE